jgi:uncharacterized protein YndB with AHSA1/START domain
MSAATNPGKVTISRIFKAPVAVVFAHFTDPLLLQLWHNPMRASAPSISVTAKAGGSFRIAMTDRDGAVHVAFGVYKEFIPDRKLVFTWQWENAAHPATTVTVLFKALGAQTEVTLCHEGFSDQDTAGRHAQGWNAMLHNLELLFT